MTDLAINLEVEVEVRVKIDADLLEEAQRQISASSPDAAITEALRRLVEEERAKRNAAHARIQKMYEDGKFDFSALGGVDE